MNKYPKNEDLDREYQDLLNRAEALGNENLVSYVKIFAESITAQDEYLLKNPRLVVETDVTINELWRTKNLASVSRYWAVFSYWNSRMHTNINKLYFASAEIEYSAFNIPREQRNMLKTLGEMVNEFEKLNG